MENSDVKNWSFGASPHNKHKPTDRQTDITENNTSVATLVI